MFISKISRRFVYRTAFWLIAESRFVSFAYPVKCRIHGTRGNMLFVSFETPGFARREAYVSAI